MKWNTFKRSTAWGYIDKTALNTLQWNAFKSSIARGYIDKTALNSQQWHRWNEMILNVLLHNLNYSQNSLYGSPPFFFICLSSLWQNSSTSLDGQQALSGRPALPPPMKCHSRQRCHIWWPLEKGLRRWIALHQCIPLLFDFWLGVTSGGWRGSSVLLLHLGKQGPASSLPTWMACYRVYSKARDGKLMI